MLGMENITIDLIVPKRFLINPEVKQARKPPIEIMDAAKAISFFWIVNLFS